jgi:O-antigen/teichoic acid export membrane protein
MDARLTRYSRYNLAGFAVSTVAGFLGGIVIARTVGGEGVGIVAAAWVLFELAKPWGTLSIMPAIRKSFEVDDEDRVFGTSLTMHLVAMLPAAGAFAALAPFLASALNSTTTVIMIGSTVLIAFIPASLGIAYLDSKKDFRGRNIVVVATNVSYLAFLLLLAVPMRTVESVATANVLSSVVASVLRLRYIKRPVLDRGLARYFTGFGARTVVVLFSNQVVFWLGTGLATAFLGAQEGGVYRVAAALAYYGFLLPDYVVSTWTFPAASDEFAKGRDTTGIYRHSTMVAVGLAGLVLAAIAVAGRWVLAIYGEEFVEGYWTMLYLAGSFAIYSVAVSAISILLTMDLPQKVMEVSVLRSVIFVVVSLVLIQEHGVNGIVAGVALSSAFAAVLLSGLAVSELKKRKETVEAP